MLVYEYDVETIAIRMMPETIFSLFLFHFSFH